MTRLFSYKVRYDIGFAPNPFHGVCTLATCKPDIRRLAMPDDWVVGVGAASNKRTGQLVYAMKVEEKLTFDEYWSDSRFLKKKVDPRGSLKYRYGDNVYHQDPEGAWIQVDSRHSLESGAPNEEHVARDTGSNAVLISSHFTYWGANGPEIPPALRDWNGVDLAEPGRGYTYLAYDAEMINRAVSWIDSLPNGYQSEPADWAKLRKRS